MITPEQINTLARLVPEWGQDVAALHLLRYGCPEKALVFGHLFNGRLETVIENLHVLSDMAQMLLAPSPLPTPAPAEDRE